MENIKVVCGFIIVFISILYSQAYSQKIQATIKENTTDGNCVDVYFKSDTNIINHDLTTLSVSVSIPNVTPQPALDITLDPALGVSLFTLPVYERTGRWQYDFGALGPTSGGNVVNFPGGAEIHIMKICFINGPSGVEEKVQLNVLADGGDHGYTLFAIGMDGNDYTNYNEPYFPSNGGSYSNGDPNLPDDAYVETAQPVFLPIELISFQARCEGGNLNLEWATSSEVNNDYFTLERSTDGYIWKEIVTIDGAGNSNTTQEYSYKDKPYGILNSDHAFYYRLKQTDIDGAYEYSDIVLASCDRKESKILQVFPNPSTGTFIIQGLRDNSEISILNARGELILTANTITNTKKIHLDVPAGVYFLVVNSDTGTVTEKMVIAN